MAKVRNSRSKQNKSKESVINYAKRSTVDDRNINALGKVQQWLLDSPTIQVAQSSSTISTPIVPIPIAIPIPSTQELEQIDKSRPLAKSQSQTHNLCPTQRAPKKVKSLSNLNEKVKLQVVYKPPFKLSLKLSTNSAVKTRVASSQSAIDASRNRRNSRIDKNRKIISANEKKKPRTALLLQSKGNRRDFDSDLVGFKLKSNHRRPEDRQQLMPTERKHESLDLTKTDLIGSSAGNSSKFNRPHTVNMSNKTEPMDTNTFKINKSASGTNIIENSNFIDAQNSHNVIENNKVLAHRASFMNNKRSNNNILNGYNIAESGKSSPNRASTSNLTKDSYKLMRSSTTNLSKSHLNRDNSDMKRDFHDMSRSNSTNLIKERHNDQSLHSNFSNLIKYPQSHTIRTSKTNLNNIENGLLPSSGVSTSTSSSNAKEK